MNIQQLRTKIAALQDATMDENKNFQSAYDEGKFDAFSAVDALLDSLQEEPVNRIPVDIKAAMQELEEKSKAFTEAHQGESFYEILAQMRGEEPVSEDLEEAAYHNCIDRLSKESIEDFKAGAQWQKEHLWKPADGDDLPEIDREVIVLYQPYPCEGNEYTVGFAHRPKEYWDGRNIETDEVTRYYPKRYDKGGWNIPDVKWWLDSNIEKLNNNEKEEI